MSKQPLLVLGFILSLWACGEDGAHAYEPPPTLGDCQGDADCPSGLRCEASVCVAEDGRPPEQPPANASHLPPVSSPGWLWTLSPETARVTAIDPETLALRSFSVAADPVALAAFPNEDRVLVLSRHGASLTTIDLEGAPRLVRHPLHRRFSSLTLSPDGAWAVLWNPDGAPLDAGLEGLIQVVDLIGGPVVHERMVGRRPTEVFFRSADGVATDAVIVSKDEVAILELSTLSTEPLPARIPLDDGHREPTTRRVVASPDGTLLLLGSITSPTLLSVDVEARRLDRVTLSGPTSDLAFLQEREVVVAILRSEGRVAWFDVRDARIDPGQIFEEEVAFTYEGCATPPCLASPGQVRFAGPRHAILFSNASPTTAFATLNFDTRALEVVDALRKPIRDLVSGPDGAHAIVFHQATPSSRADPYERWVDESEGYSIVDLASGRTQLRLTGMATPHRVVFARGDRHAGVILRDPAASFFGVDAVDLHSMVPFSLGLPSLPEDGGPVTREGRIWISQRHPLGRISFVDLVARSMETVTGYDFNARIE